jgi:acyl-CoA oxidase
MIPGNILRHSLLPEDLTAEDVLNVTPRYWEFHGDPLLVMDCSVATILTIHFNLCVGTLAMYLAHRPDLKETIDHLLSFEWKYVWFTE